MKKREELIKRYFILIKDSNGLFKSQRGEREALESYSLAELERFIKNLERMVRKSNEKD